MCKKKEQKKQKQQCKIDCHFKIKSIKNIQGINSEEQSGNYKMLTRAGGRFTERRSKWTTLTEGGNPFGAQHASEKAFGSLQRSGETKATVCTRRPSVRHRAEELTAPPSVRSPGRAPPAVTVHVAKISSRRERGLKRVCAVAHRARNNKRKKKKKKKEREFSHVCQRRQGGET